LFAGTVHEPVVVVVTALLSPIVTPTEALALAKITPASALTVVCREPETVIVVPLAIVSVTPGGPNTRVPGSPMYLSVWVVLKWLPGG
jgi:hypothetical protein